MFGVNSIGVCQFNCSASNTFSISAEALNRWESAIERGKTRTLTASWQSMAPWLSYSQSLAPARRLNPARMTLRWTACQRSSAAAAVQSRIQWWDGGCPEAAVTSQTPLSGAWACLCCSSFGSCQPFSQLCELPSSFSINSFFLLKFTIIFCYLMSRFLPQWILLAQVWEWQTYRKPGPLSVTCKKPRSRVQG